MRGIGALTNPPTKSFESGSSGCRDLPIAQPIPVATIGHRTTGRSQSPLDRGRCRSRKPVSDGWVVGREVLASFDHLMLGWQAKSNNLGATKKKSVLGCILVLLRSRIYRTRSRKFQLLELRELRKSQAITKDVPPLMDIDPVSVEVGSTDTKSDADPSWAQAPELVEEMRSCAPTLTIPQLFALVFANNPKLVGMANRKPDFHSAATRKTNSDIEPTDDPKAAYEKLRTMAEEMALREDIAIEKAFAKLYEKDSPLARCASRHVVLEPAARW